MSHASTSPPLRVAAVWVATALATAAVLLLGAPPVLAVAREGASAPFESMLVAGCAVLAALGCLALLLITTSVVVGLATGRLPRRVGPIRRAVLTACGVAVLATTVPAAAHAGGTGHRHPSAIAGLPLPDRAIGARTAPHGTVGPVLRVRPGDSLWAVARSRLGEHASDAEVAAYCLRLYEHNAAAIGPDPDLILPGLPLRLPSTRPLDR